MLCWTKGEVRFFWNGSIHDISSFLNGCIHDISPFFLKWIYILYPRYVFLPQAWFTDSQLQKERFVFKSIILASTALVNIDFVWLVYIWYCSWPHINVSKWAKKSIFDIAKDTYTFHQIWTPFPKMCAVSSGTQFSAARDGELTLQILPIFGCQGWWVKIANSTNFGLPGMVSLNCKFYHFFGCQGW